MALETVQKILDEARVLLQDTIEPYRYETARLVTYINTALLEARRLRPDAFLRPGPVPTYTTGNTAAVIEFPEIYRAALLFYVVGMAQLRDEENVTDARAAVFLQKYTASLTSWPS